MKQILQNIRNGETQLADVPAPKVQPGSLLIATRRSVVSAGTERMLVEFGKANWLQKARQQPDKVRMVLDKVRTDGLASTVEAVRSKLDTPIPLGYANAGVVLAVGEGVEGFCVGDRVVSNGKHAEVVCVPQNLCARIPDAVDDDAAAFTVLGAIALQGVRLADPTLGECVAVTGLGLIGLLCVQMLIANGCRVLAIDFDPERVKLAESFGAEGVDLSAGRDPVAAADSFSRGRGVDAVLLTLATDSSEPVHQAATMCRKRGRIVLVGVTGLSLSRADFFEKELSFQVSCSYGPGRYDLDYEEKGRDYPVGFVRWTEQRNFEAVLDQMASGAVDPRKLISHRFDIGDAADAYGLLSSEEKSLGIVLEYPDSETAVESTSRIANPTRDPQYGGGAAICVIGAGNYASRVLIPAFRAAGTSLHTVVSATGVSAEQQARKHGFSAASTDTQSMMDESIDAVVVATRHDSHAALVESALKAGKAVFCEKPLCIHREEHESLETVAESSGGLLMVGFNRRYAPLVQDMKTTLDRLEGPRSVMITVNAGAIPADHWTQDPSIGGGRLIGEACHFIDLARHLADSPILKADRADLATSQKDSFVLTLQHENGSASTVHYLANGHRSVPKERVEVYCAGTVLQLDNFRVLRAFGSGGPKKRKLWRQDKGQGACVAAFVHALKSGDTSRLIPREQLFEVSRVTLSLNH